MDTQTIPEGYTSVTPYLVVKEVESLVKFLMNAFEAEKIFSMPDEQGNMSHTEMKIGNAMIMMGRQMQSGKQMQSMLYIYTDNVDTYFKKAVDAGGIAVRDPEDQFYGDRTAAVQGPMGNIWYIAQQKEVLSNEELQERMKSK